MSAKLAVVGAVTAGLFAVGGVASAIAFQPAPAREVQMVQPAADVSSADRRSDDCGTRSGRIDSGTRTGCHVSTGGCRAQSCRTRSSGSSHTSRNGLRARRQRCPPQGGAPRTVRWRWWRPLRDAEAEALTQEQHACVDVGLIRRVGRPPCKGRSDPGSNSERPTTSKSGDDPRDRTCGAAEPG